VETLHGTEGISSWSKISYCVQKRLAKEVKYPYIIEVCSVMISYDAQVFTHMQHILEGRKGAVPAPSGADGSRDF